MTMSSELFVKLIVGLIGVISALISAYVIPYLKAKVDSTLMADLISFVEKCVKWANQTIPEEEWKRKKNEVTALVKDYAQQHLQFDLTDEQIDAIIEAIVYSVKHN